jgi:hypothetical protein
LRGKKASGKKKRYTKFQLFILIYLASEEAKQRQKERALDDHSWITHHSQGSVIPEPISVNINELSDITPSDIIPDVTDMDIISNQISELENDGFIQIADRWAQEYAKINAKAKGRFFIRSYFAKQLIDYAIIDEEKYMSNVEHQEGASSELKNFFKNQLLPKMKEKATNESIDMLFLAMKQYGSPAIVLGINLLLNM